MPISQPLNDANIEHQFDLIRYSNGVASTLNPVYDEVYKLIRNELADFEDVTTVAALNALVKRMKEGLNEIFTDWDESELQFIPEDVAKSEIDFQETSTEAAVEGFSAKIPELSVVLAQIFSTPLMIGQEGSAVDVKTYMKSWKSQEINRITSRVVTGFYNADETQSQTIKAITGNKSKGYEGGILKTSKANVESVAKTVVNHASTEAKDKFSKVNDDLIIGMLWVSTLDSKTSAICRGRDGTEYLFSEYGHKYPRPPAHRRCRSALAPILSDEYSFLSESRKRPAVSEGKAQQVSGKTTYYEWLKRQPAPVQDKALGKTQGKIFRNAGLSPEEFKKAATDQLGYGITLEEMANSNKKIAEYLSTL